MHYKLSIAPMMDRTDLYFRNFMRLITQHTLLYTEMIHANAIIHDKNKRFDIEQECKGPTALQIGCSNPKIATTLAKKIKNYNFQEININCGCPSNKVLKGDFGAILMKKPKLVAQIVDSIKEHTDIPITIKTRIGIDNLDSEDFLYTFVDELKKVNVNTVIIHARKAILKGLSPHQNRTVPPLNYDRVKFIKKSFKNMNIILNGGLTNFYQSKLLLKEYDGIMFGRYAWDNPWVFSQADQIFFNKKYKIINKHEIIDEYINYSLKYIQKGHPIRRLIRPLFNIFYASHGNKYWKLQLNEVINNNLSINKLSDIAEDIVNSDQKAA